MTPTLSVAITLCSIVAWIGAKDPSTLIVIVCLVCTFASVTYADMRVHSADAVENFGSGRVICKHVDDLDVDMPFDAHLKHFVFRDRNNSLMDIVNCDRETFKRVDDDRHGNDTIVKWRGPPSSSFLKSDSMTMFVTLSAEHELPLPGKEVSILVARAEPFDQLSDNTTMAVVQLGLSCSEDGRAKLFGECGDTRVEIDYPPRAMPRIHLLAFTANKVQVGYCDVWAGALEVNAKNRGAPIKSTSVSPVVINASSHPIGDIVSVAVYDQYAENYIEDAIRGISAHAMQGNSIYADLLARYRAKVKSVLVDD
jgi:hypothetical protein